jgi:hypothetical protein
MFARRASLFVRKCPAYWSFDSLIKAPFAEKMNKQLEVRARSSGCRETGEESASRDWQDDRVAKLSLLVPVRLGLLASRVSFRTVLVDVGLVTRDNEAS